MRAIAFLLTAGLASTAWAGPPDDNPATSTVPTVIPYEGVLAVDGVPLNLRDAVAVRFYLCGRPDQDVATCWSQLRNVIFTNGRFSVLLGEGANPPIDSTIFDADDVYVRIDVAGTLLAGAQRITPVPYALWSTHAADLTIARDAHVGRNVDVGGNLQVTGETQLGNHTTVAGDATVAGGLTVGGAASVGGQLQLSAQGLRLPPPDGAREPLLMRGLWILGPDNSGLPFTAHAGEQVNLIRRDQGICWLSNVDSRAAVLGRCAVGFSPPWWVLVNDPPAAGPGATCEATCMAWQ